MLTLLSRDGKIIFISMAARSFGYVAVGITLPIYLAKIRLAHSTILLYL